MAKLAVPPVESSTIFIDDPSTRHSVLGPRQIEVRCVYLDDIIGKRVYVCVVGNFTSLLTDISTNVKLLTACLFSQFNLCDHTNPITAKR